MTKHDRQRLVEILDSILAIEGRIARDPRLDSEDLFDAVNMRLVQIGEEANRLDPNLRKTEPDIPWQDITSMRNRLAHHYAATDHETVVYVVTDELPKLKVAVQRMQRRL